MNNSRIRFGVGTAAALLALLLSGCSGSGAGTGTSTDTGSAPSPSASETMAPAALMTADSSLGSIVVDKAGMTVYVFDKDTADSGTSACEGDCLAKWPAVVADSDSPTADGVTGTLGTITRTDDGTKQLTLNGLPLYYWASDAAPGDVTGQAVGGVWWVVGADGAKMMESAK
ncbi:MAG: hypothetical protein ABIX44_04465 [Cryobacterium sp.]